jgi:hypothetical protein
MRGWEIGVWRMKDLDEWDGLDEFYICCCFSA